MSLPIALPTYSFADVFGTLIGPGGTVNFGMGSGQAEEGIDFDQNEDKNKMTVGAGGDFMHALILNDSAKAGIHFLKTSPQAAAMNQMFSYQKSSTIFWGKNIISVTNLATGDHYTGQGAAFKRRPANRYAKDPNQLVWEFDIGVLYVVLGGRS